MSTYKLNDEEIAMMCDIASTSVVKTNTRKDAELDRLLSEGLIEILPTDDSGEERFKITPEGQKRLADLGVGANEA